VHPCKEFAVIAATVKDNREAALTHYLPDSVHDSGHDLSQRGISLLGEKQQRPPLLIVDEVAEHTWQRHPSLGVPALGQLALAGVRLHMAIYVEVGGGDDSLLDPAPRQQGVEAGGLALFDQVAQLAPQGFHHRGSLRAHQ